MKKFFIILGIIIVALFALVYCLLFTQPGNNILRPVIESKAKEASGMDIKLDKFSLRFSSIDVEVSVMEHIKGKVSGAINLFSQSFDLDYAVNADKLPKFGSIEINEPLSLSGCVAGDLKNISANGSGDIFGAALKFDAALADFKPVKINANANNLQIAKVLAVLGQPIYSNGVVSLNANINPNQQGVLGGNAQLRINNGLIYKEAMKKAFNMTMPSNIPYNAAADFALENGSDLVGKSDLTTPFVNLKTTNTKYNLNTSAASSDFALNVANLQELEWLAGMPLRGAVNLYGDAKYSANGIKANIKSDNFAHGKVQASYSGDTFGAKLQNVKLAQVLYMLVQPSYADADMSANIDFSSIAKKDGAIKLDIASGLINSDTMKKEFNITLPKSDFSAKTDVKMKGGAGDFDMKILSTLANLNKFAGTFDINKIALKSDYQFNAPDLSKFDGVTGLKMVGKMALDGAVNYESSKLHIDGKSAILGGNINFDFTDGKLDLKGSQLSSLEGLKMLSYPPVFDAKIDLDADYFVANKSGVFGAKSPRGKLVRTQLSDLVKAFAKIDLTSDAYEDVLLDGTIEGANINFDYSMKSVHSNLTIDNGKVLGSALNIPFKLMIEKTDIPGKILGTTKDPKVTLDTSAYLKGKAEKEIDKQIEKGTQKLLDKLFK